MKSPSAAVTPTPTLSIDDAFDRLNDVNCTLKFLSDMLIPSDDLHLVGREDFSTAMNFLQRELKQAQSVILKAVYSGGGHHD